MLLNKINSFNRTFLLPAVLLLFGACASVVAPTGGKKDETPPKLKEVIPPEQTVNFNSEKVVFTFDVSDPQQNRPASTLQIEFE